MMTENNYSDYFHYTIYCTNCHRKALEFINNISRIILILIIGLHVLSKLTSENNSKTIIRKRKSIPNFALIYTNQSCSFYTLFELPHYNKHNVHRRNYPVQQHCLSDIPDSIINKSTGIDEFILIHFPWRVVTESIHCYFHLFCKVRHHCRENKSIACKN